MKRKIKSGLLVLFVSLPILASLLFASSEDCADYFTGYCFDISINNSSPFPVCFEDALVAKDEC